MKENITNRPDIEEARQAKVIEEHAHKPTPELPNAGATGDEARLPSGMREKVETIEVSTFKPKP